MPYEFYATNDPNKVGVRDRQWQGHIIRREDGRWSPESNLDLRFDTMQEAAEAEMNQDQGIEPLLDLGASDVKFGSRRRSADPGIRELPLVPAAEETGSGTRGHPRVIR